MKRFFASMLTVAVLALGGGLSVDTLGQGAPAGERVGTTAARAATPLKLTLPLKEGSVRFLVIGDTGTGTEKQQQLADVMLRYRQVFPYEFILLMGDNMYGGEKPADFKMKFE